MIELIPSEHDDPEFPSLIQQIINGALFDPGNAECTLCIPKLV